MRIALAGSGRLGTLMFDALLYSTHEIVAVLQNGRRQSKFRRWVMESTSVACGGRSSVIGIAHAHRIPVMWLERMTEDELTPLRACAPDIILVGSFGLIFKRPLLDLPRIGCVNCHCALLPRHRGPNPFAAVVHSGDAETGVTFHVMDEGIDTGPILDQTRLAIRSRETMATMHYRTAELAAARVVDVVDGIERCGLQGTSQDSRLATYDSHIEGDALHIDWNRSAEEIDRLVRACCPSPLARFRWNGRSVYVGNVEYTTDAVPAAPGSILAVRPHVRVATGEGTVLLMDAYTTRPIPWRWPAPWCHLRLGTVLG